MENDINQDIIAQYKSNGSDCWTTLQPEWKANQICNNNEGR